MKQVTNPVTLGQMKRISAILVDTIPQTEITKIMGRILVDGGLKTKMGSFWRNLIMEFSPYELGEVLPSGDIGAVQKLIDNVGNFRREEFDTPLESKSKELAIIPFNSRLCFRNIWEEVLDAGYEPAMPEDLLGTILRWQRGLCIGMLSRVIVHGRTFNRYASMSNYAGIYFMVFETEGGKMRLVRERLPEDGYLEGEYSVLAVKKLA